MGGSGYQLRILATAQMGGSALCYRPLWAVVYIPNEGNSCVQLLTPLIFPLERIFYRGFLFVGQIKAPLGDADKEKAQECNVPDRHGNVANTFTTTHRSPIMPLGQNGGL